MHVTRPKNLNLWTIRFPLTALVSILHRISGVLLFLAIPLVSAVFGQSLTSAGAFNQIKYLLGQGLGLILAWLFLCLSLYHALAGIRHVVMDIGYGKTWRQSQFSALITLILTILLTLSLGV